MQLWRAKLLPLCGNKWTKILSNGATLSARYRSCSLAMDARAKDTNPHHKLGRSYKEWPRIQSAECAVLKQEVCVFFRLFADSESFGEPQTQHEAHLRITCSTSGHLLHELAFRLCQPSPSAPPCHQLLAKTKRWHHFTPLKRPVGSHSAHFLCLIDWAFSESVWALQKAIFVAVSVPHC